MRFSSRCLAKTIIANRLNKFGLAAQINMTEATYYQIEIL